MILLPFTYRGGTIKLAPFFERKNFPVLRRPPTNQLPIQDDSNWIIQIDRESSVKWFPVAALYHLGVVWMVYRVEHVVNKINPQHPSLTRKKKKRPTKHLTPVSKFNLGPRILIIQLEIRSLTGAPTTHSPCLIYIRNRLRMNPENLSV